MNELAGKHWNQVYSTRSPDSLSWFQQEAVPSLRALDLAGAGPDKSLIDVGGGASTLVDALLDRGWSDVSILDIAAPALDAAKQRLEGRAALVNWIVADVTAWKPTGRYDVWHDRAVFHFLTGESDREAYREALLSALQPGAAVVMATFGPRGPERCSGLPVRRYDAEELAAEIGSGFTKIADWTEDHLTPAGAAQAFTWCVLRKR